MRVLLRGHISDFTGFVTTVAQGRVALTQTTGLNIGNRLTFDIKNVVTVVEILSCSLFYRFRRMAAGERMKGKNIQ